MAMFGLPAGGELVILSLIFLLRLVPAVGMYLVARRVGYSGGALAAWVLGYAFFGFIALIVFALAAWPVPPTQSAVASTGVR